MPIAQILQSLKGTCRFCRQPAGLLQRDHQDCQETHRSGWQEMVQLAAQAASAHTFNEAALRQTLQAIANRSRRIIRSRVEGDRAKVWVLAPGLSSDAPGGQPVDAGPSPEAELAVAREQVRALQELADYRGKLLDEAEWRYRELLEELRRS